MVFSLLTIKPYRFLKQLRLPEILDRKKFLWNLTFLNRLIYLEKVTALFHYVAAVLEGDNGVDCILLLELHEKFYILELVAKTFQNINCMNKLHCMNFQSLNLKRATEKVLRKKTIMSGTYQCQVETSQTFAPRKDSNRELS